MEVENESDSDDEGAQTRNKKPNKGAASAKNLDDSFEEVVDKR